MPIFWVYTWFFSYIICWHFKLWNMTFAKEAIKCASLTNNNMNMQVKKDNIIIMSRSHIASPPPPFAEEMITAWMLC